MKNILLIIAILCTSLSYNFYIYIKYYTLSKKSAKHKNAPLGTIGHRNWLTYAHTHQPRPWNQRILAERTFGTDNRNRHDREAGGYGKSGSAPLERQQSPGGRAGALGEKHYRHIVSMQTVVERRKRLFVVVTVDHNLPGSFQGGAKDRNPGEFLFGHPAGLAVVAKEAYQSQRVEVAAVVAHHHTVGPGAEVLDPLALHRDSEDFQSPSCPHQSVTVVSRARLEQGNGDKQGEHCRRKNQENDDPQTVPEQEQNPPDGPGDDGRRTVLAVITHIGLTSRLADFSLAQPQLRRLHYGISKQGHDTWQPGTRSRTTAHRKRQSRDHLAGRHKRAVDRPGRRETGAHRMALDCCLGPPGRDLQSVSAQGPLGVCGGATTNA